MNADPKILMKIDAATLASEIAADLNTSMADLIGLLARLSEPRAIEPLSKAWAQMDFHCNDTIHRLKGRLHFEIPIEDVHAPQTWAAHYAKHLSEVAK
jgi:hypothetical protein